MSFSYRNQSIDLLCKSIDWFLYKSILFNIFFSLLLFPILATDLQLSPDFQAYANNELLMFRIFSWNFMIVY